MLARGGYLRDVRPALAVEHLRLGQKLAVRLAPDLNDLVADDRRGRGGTGMVQRGQPLPGASAQGVHAVRLLGRQLLARYEAADHHRLAFIGHRRGVVQCSRQARPGGPAVRPGS